MTRTEFNFAKPVWVENREKEKNLSVCLTSKVKRGSALLRIAAHTLYQAFLNGKILAEGPARAGHGYYRVDEIDLTDKLDAEVNVIEIIVAGYNLSSFYLLNEPSFVCAEIIADGVPVAVTGGDGFESRIYTERVSKVQRYSFQRPFSEVYALPGKYEPVRLVPTESKRFITREVPYPKYDAEPIADVISKGSFEINEPETLDFCKNNYQPFIRGTGGDYAFELDELEVFTEREIRRLSCTMSPCTISGNSFEVGKNECFISDLGKELTGFISFDIETTGGRLFITFDEVLRDGDIDFSRMTTTNCVIYDFEPGKYSIVGMEPYSMRYVKFHSCAEKIVINNPRLIKFEFGGEIRPAPEINDPELKKIYDAAVSTFKQNTVDIYMDCPSRERAGWLCDSYFTSRTEYELTGKSAVEHAFLDNFVFSEKFGVPSGMLPMCYPSDQYDATYIPNWAMWYGIELKEYFERTGDRRFVDSARERMYALVDFFRRFENADGLLDKLESWVFVEWSHSNDLVQDINYPSNMLYSLFKRSIGELYSDDGLIAESYKLAETVREKSYRNGWFCDNSVYNENGVAELTGEVTETCQYYAFFTGVATKETHGELWDKLVKGFGPHRKENNGYPDVYFSNAFIGNYLRMELLFREGLYDQMLEEIKGYFGYMADKTGTLWENDGDYASCNHGFASHVLVWLRRIFC